MFNDWGVLRLLRREFPHLTPVQGRLLNKSLRDPRVTSIYAETAPAAPESSLRVLQRSNLDDASYLSLLARYNVRAVEMDNLPQGSDLSFSGVDVFMYVPFGFISTARVCMAAALHYRGPEKFQPGAPCRHECQSHQLEYRTRIRRSAIAIKSSCSRATPIFIAIATRCFARSPPTRRKGGLRG